MKEFILIEISETYEALELFDDAIAVEEELLTLIGDNYRKIYREERLKHLKSLKNRR
jgi:hypothetical protein